MPRIDSLGSFSPADKSERQPRRKQAGPNQHFLPRNAPPLGSLKPCWPKLNEAEHGHEQNQDQDDFNRVPHAATPLAEAMLLP